MDKYSYITVMNEGRYLPGVLCVVENIRKYCEHDITVLISNDLDFKIYDILKMNHVKYIMLENIEVDFNTENCMRYWGKTLFKLKAFELWQFDKIILVDSDMLITDSLEELFLKEDMSSVPDKNTLLDGTGIDGLNSGIMVIEPAKHKLSDIMKTVGVVAEKKAVFGDQDVLNELYPNWSSQERLHLQSAYNMVGYRVANYKAKEKIKVVHYIGSSKPWMWSKRQYWIRMMKVTIKNGYKGMKYLKKYRKDLDNICKKINSYYNQVSVL